MARTLLTAVELHGGMVSVHSSGEGQGASVNPGVVMQLRVVGDQPRVYAIVPLKD